MWFEVHGKQRVKTLVGFDFVKLGSEVTKEEIISFFEGKIAKWWTPDDVVFTEAIPIGATGKVLKHKLREQYDAHGR